MMPVVANMKLTVAVMIGAMILRTAVKEGCCGVGGGSHD
jgi:hypothetical protein